MPVAYFQTQLTVQPIGGGQAELLVPEALHSAGCQFVIVKDGGEEGIVRVEGRNATLNALAGADQFKRLSEQQVAELRASYPPPRLKERYRVVATSEPGIDDVLGATATIEQVAVDEQSNRIVDTLQTVRAGFYLIDVPVNIADSR
ncbi:MAG: hypothetical protein HGA19_13560 [Oscillochloris sp.]|nr:hypothetical protein [Oscillochloris sp.]